MARSRSGPDEGDGVPDVSVEDGRSSDGAPSGIRALPPWHPPLLAAWSVLTVWAGNVTEVPPGDGFVLLATTVGLVVAAWIVLAVVARAARRDHPVSRAAIATTIAAAGVFLSGRFASGLDPSVGLALVAGVALVGIVVAVALPATGLPVVTAPLDVFTLVAVVLAAAPIATTLLRQDAGLAVVDGAGVATEPTAEATTPASGGQEPDALGASPDTAATPTRARAPGRRLDRDVFYIVPDRHPRADTAAEFYDIDLQPFQSFLEERGFTIQDEALANYPRTAHSLNATWYLDYLPDLLDDKPTDPSSIDTLYRMLSRAPLGEIMTEAGADYVHIGSWWWPTRSSKAATTVFDSDAPNEFTSAWRASTGLRWYGATEAEEGMDRRREQYAIGLAQLQELRRVAALPHDNPRFVLVHLTIPHPPMVYAPDGSYVDQETEASYTRAENLGRQVTFIDTWLQDFVDDVVSGDEATDPIIVIQSDEGPNPKGLNTGDSYTDWADLGTEKRREKLATFSAWYLPGIDEAPPEDITGVNTWRFILDHYLGTDYGLLEDRAYIYPSNDDYYDYEDVTDEVD